jgi:hypothetical protein
LKRELTKLLAIYLVTSRVYDPQWRVAVSFQIQYLLSRLMRVRLLDRGLQLEPAKSISDLISHNPISIRRSPEDGERKAEVKASKQADGRHLRFATASRLALLAVRGT